MQDKETDSYWALMTGTAIAGALKGTRLEELPVGEKARWGDWRRKHPRTLVLSVAGAEHVENNPYDKYFASESGYRGARARDPRLPTKEPVFAFRIGPRAYAVAARRAEGGAAFEAEGAFVFLYRPPGASVYESTRAFRSRARIERRDGAWIDTASGARFDPAPGSFNGAPDARPAPLQGLDTYWYIWSLTNPDTDLLTGGPSRP
jgi:hypothetical protein